MAKNTKYKFYCEDDPELYHWESDKSLADVKKEIEEEFNAEVECIAVDETE